MAHPPSPSSDPMSKLATLKLVKKKVKRFKKSKKKEGLHLENTGTHNFDKTSYHSTQVMRPRDTGVT